MSGQLKIWNDGEALCTVELQRVADVAASSEDHIHDFLLTPDAVGSSTYDKKVYPLLHEPPDSSFNYGRAMVYPGASAGTVTVIPASYVIGAFSNSIVDNPSTLLSATKQSFTLPATAFPSSGGSNGRTDTVYALVQRTATTAARKVKDPATGNVSTQTITIYKDVTVTLGSAHGAEDGSFTPPTLSADSSTAWYIPLANIKLDDGAGGAWTQGTAIAQSRITQTWNAGWIKRNRVQLAESASIMSDTFNSSVNGRASTPLSNRWGATISVAAILQAKTSASGTYKTIDNRHDWGQRMAKVYLGKFVESGGSNSNVPDATTSVPLAFRDTENKGFFGFYWIPIKPSSGVRYIIGPSGFDPIGNGDETFFLAVDSSGNLVGEFISTTLPGGVSYYGLIIEATDQFKF